MKITRKTLEKIIKEELEEAMTMAQLDLSKSDPNEKLLQLMGKVMNRAMEMMGTDESALGTKLESEMSKMSNEIVTLVSKGLDDIDGMAQELVERFREKYQG